MDLAVSPGRTQLARAGASVAMAAAAVAVLLATGRPPEPTIALLMIAAVAATELLLVDFPDRRGISVAALPVLFAASDSAATAVWAASIGTLIGSVGRRAAPAQSAFAFVRAAAAASIATTALELIGPGRLGAAELPVAAGPALLVVVLFAGVSEGLNALERRVGGLPAPSRVDLIVSLGLVPLALVAWALRERLGANGLALAGGGLLALLVVVRSSVNASTRNADLERLTALAQQVAASTTPGESLAALAAGLPAWVRFDQLWLALPADDSPPAIHTVGRELLPTTMALTPELARLADRGPVAVPARMVGARPDVAVLADGYGKAGVLLIARQSKPFTAEESALLDLLLGQLSATLEQIRLVDRLERAMVALKAAQQERDDFVNVMTHDLRQPLAGMLGYAQLLERSLRGTGKADEKQLKYAHGIALGGERMMRMVSNLLEISRMESGHIELEPAIVQLDHVIDEVVETLQASIELKRQSVRVDVTADVPPVETSEALLRESLANLVGNAVKYTPEGGQISIQAGTLKDGRIEIVIADSGIGIPSDALPRIFARFFRTGQNEVRELRGSGLGLALTKMMVEKVGGEIRVESELGKGSRFTVVLPARLGSFATPATQPTVAAPEPDRAGVT